VYVEQLTPPQATIASSCCVQQLHQTDAILKQFRRYATEGPAKPSSLPYAAAGAAILGVGGYYALYRDAGHAPSATEAKESVKSAVGEEPKTAFTGGDQGFISLKLENVENINHNTKKFRFSLPDGDAVSGLHVACTFCRRFDLLEMANGLNSCPLDKVPAH
jgi:cytochrome-b5 reductase